MSIELSDANQFISWLKTKTHLNSLAPNAAKRFVKRGDVYWCHFGINIGSEMSKSTPRPAVIVSNYQTNKNSSNVIVVPVTHSERDLPYSIPINPVKNENGDVILDGYADTASVTSVSKARLEDLIAKLSAAQMRDIDKGIAISLGLLRYYNNEKEKYDSLLQYAAQIKNDRNISQDALNKIKDAITLYDFSEKSQEIIKQILDIE